MEDFLWIFNFHALAYACLAFYFGNKCYPWLGKAFKAFWNSVNIPGPISLPFVGSVGFIFDALCRKVQLKSIQGLLNKYKGFFRVIIGNRLFLIVSDPSDIEELMQSENVSTYSPLFTEMSCEFMGEGFMSEKSLQVRFAANKPHKDIITSFLQEKVNEPNQNILQKNCEILVENMGNLCDKNLENISPKVDRCIADMLSEILLGNETSFQTGSMDNIIESCEKIPQAIQDRRSRFWLYNDEVYSITKFSFEKFSLTDNILPFIEKMVTKRINHINGAEIENPSCLTDMLLNNYKHIQYGPKTVVKETEFLWNMGMIMICDTMKFFILMLAMNKNSQNKAVEEIKKFYGDSIEVPVKYEHLQHFPYLKMCLKEVLRLFPQLPISSKYAVKDVKMKNKNITIAADTEILFAHFIANRNESFWNNSNSYMPERFVDKNNVTKYFDVFCPFKMYSENTNEDLGEQIILTTIIYLLRKYEFENDWKIEQLPLETSTITKSNWGYKATIYKRNWK